jgi:hypothetical protein
MREDTMTKKKIALASIAAMSLTVIALAQENGTLVLRSGEKVSAQLMDLGGVGFTVKVDGQERRIPANEVAAIDFTGGGNLSNSDWDKLGGGGQALVLKSGETLNGQLVDIGGSSPLRMTFRTTSGERDFPSSDIARIIMARPENANSSSNSANTGALTAQGVSISSQQQWTPTGITVRRGDWVTFNTSGNVRIGGEGNPTAGPDGLNAQAPGAPLANAPAGALVGRVGNSAPFMVGSRNRVQMPAAGQLFLGVNDGHLQDNDGAFQVQVAREVGALRR